MIKNLQKIFSIAATLFMLALLAPAPTVHVASAAPLLAKPTAGTASGALPVLRSVWVSSGSKVVLPSGTVQYVASGTLIQGSGSQVASILGVVATQQASDLLLSAVSQTQYTIAVAPSTPLKIAISVAIPIAVDGQLHYSLAASRGGLPVAAATVDQQHTLPEPEQYIFGTQIFTIVTAAKAPRMQVFRSASRFNLLC